ncbi:atp-dependent rna helicase suv3l [Quercus suber]|uniref:Atp-dependent rna helicase suv3l n=1 Tax=Quercus suber TaxID=58331 RepID=A0AAW0KHC3_QUESU
MGMPKGSTQNDSELLDLETKHQVLSMSISNQSHLETKIKVAWETKASTEGRWLREAKITYQII